MRVILFKMLKIFSAIYLESGKFQIYMINSLVSLHWAEICRLDNPKSALANNAVSALQR